MAVPGPHINTATNRSVWNYRTIYHYSEFIEEHYKAGVNVFARTGDIRIIKFGGLEIKNAFP